MNEKTCRRLITALFVCVFVVMLLFNILTPMISDDYAHYFGNNGERFNSLGDIFSALGRFRSEVNGRVVAHFFAFSFLSLPHVAFCIFNSAVFTLFVWLISGFVKSEDEKRNSFLLTVLIMLIWLFIPAFGQIFLWETGACNYLFGLVLDIILVYPLFCRYSEKHCRIDDSAVLKILAVIAAILAGAWSEHGAAGTICACALFVILIWIKEKKAPVFQIALTAAAVVGFAFLMTAPATSSRSSGGTGLADNIKTLVGMLRQYEAVPLAVWLSLLLTGIYRGLDKRVIVASAVLVISGLASSFTFVFAAYVPARGLMLVGTFTVTAVLLLCAEHLKAGEKTAVIAASGVLAVAFLLSFILGAGDILSLKLQEGERQSIISQAIADGDDTAVIPAYAASTMYPAKFDEELTDDPEDWYNDLVAKYYGIDSVIKQG